MSFTQIQMTVNPTRRTWARSATDQSGITGNDRPTLRSRETSVLCLSFVDNAGDAYTLEAADEFELAIDSTRRHVTNTADLMAYSDNTAVDVAGDWADISRANGKISIRIDCTRDLFESRITETDGLQDCWLQVVLTPTGLSNQSTMVQDICNAGDNVINRYI